MSTELAMKFEDYANSLRGGFLKHHKAFSILQTLRQMPEILADDARLLSYLKNCLKMEGFSDASVELIMGWILERKVQITS